MMHGTGVLPFHVGDPLSKGGRYPIWDASSSGVPIAVCHCKEDAEALVASANARMPKAAEEST